MNGTIYIQTPKPNAPEPMCSKCDEKIRPVLYNLANTADKIIKCGICGQRYTVTKECWRTMRDLGIPLTFI